VTKRDYKKPESALRDYLAEKLNLIEPGLTLVQKEFPLPNPRGAKGFIDILARDIFGHRVVIEIKRSDSTARQALHELHKYVELLQENQGLSNAEVRCILISTDWHELAVPFGHFQRTAKYPVDEYKAVTIEGEVTGLEKIDAVQAPSPIAPFRLHSAHLFMDEKSYKAFLPRLEDALKEAGVTSAIILSMRSKPDRDSIIFPFCQYLLICDVAENHRKKYLVKARREILDPDDENELVNQYESQVTLAVYLAARTRSRRCCYESSFPEKFTADRQNWDIDKIVRVGRLKDDTLVTDEDVHNHLLGYTGTGQIAYNGLASPAFPAAWAAAKERVLRCLIGNKPWTRIAEHVFKLIEDAPGRTTAAFHIYNPCDTVMMLYQMVGNNDVRFWPAMEIGWFSDQQKARHIVSGVVGWDGKTKPEKLKQMIRRVFHSDAFGYFLARTLGEIFAFDVKIMRHLGLSYHAAHFVGEGGKDRGRWLEFTDGKITERGLELLPIRPLQQFVEQNIDYFVELVKWFRATSFGA
jgi:hypothetical protein